MNAVDLGLADNSSHLKSFVQAEQGQMQQLVKIVAVSPLSSILSTACFFPFLLLERLGRSPMGAHHRT